MFDGRFAWETSFASLQVSVFSKFYSDGSGTVCQYLETSQKFFEYISQFIGAPSRKQALSTPGGETNKYVDIELR